VAVFPICVVMRRVALQQEQPLKMVKGTERNM
jgi:hypothetical protein